MKISQVIGIDNLLEIDKNKPSFLINYKLLFTNKKTKIKQEILSKISEIKDTVKLYFENIKNLTNINNHRFFEKDISDYINELLENGKINRFQILQLIPLKITEN